MDIISDVFFVFFGMDWLFDGCMLVIECFEGKFSLFDFIIGVVEEICNLLLVYWWKYVGMMDVLVYFDYEENGWIYLVYIVGWVDSVMIIVIDRVKLNGSCLEDW